MSEPVAISEALKPAPEAPAPPPVDLPPGGKVGMWWSGWDKAKGPTDQSARIAEATDRLTTLASEGKVGSGAWNESQETIRVATEEQKAFDRNQKKIRDWEAANRENDEAELMRVIGANDPAQTVEDVKLAEMVLGVDHLSEADRLAYDRATGGVVGQAEILTEVGRGLRQLKVETGRIPTVQEARERLRSLDNDPDFRSKLFGDPSRGIRPDPNVRAQREALKKIAFHTARRDGNA